MENTMNLSVILPINTSKVKDFDSFFKSAISSILIQKTKPNELIIVHTKEESLIEYLESFDFGELNVIKVLNQGDDSYSSQINLGVKNASNEWVSFFEFDDEYSGIWFNNVEKYSKIYPDVEAFLPIVVDVDNKSTFAGFTNEATFAANFAQEMGILTNDMLHNYQNFQTAGMAIKKSVIEDFG